MPAAVWDSSEPARARRNRIGCSSAKRITVSSCGNVMGKLCSKKPSARSWRWVCASFGSARIGESWRLPLVATKGVPICWLNKNSRLEAGSITPNCLRFGATSAAANGRVSGSAESKTMGANGESRACASALLGWKSPQTCSKEG